MEHYDVICCDGADYFVRKARRFTGEEKVGFSADCRETGFYGIAGSRKELEHIHSGDLPRRRCDGWFPGSGCHAWIITAEESAAYVALNERRAVEKVAARRAKKIEDMERLISACESQRDHGRGMWAGLPTKAEANRRLKALNNILNEGGDGFLPHIYSIEEYEWAKARLAALREGKGH